MRNRIEYSDAAKLALSLCLFLASWVPWVGEAKAEPGSCWQVGTPIATYWAGPAITDAVARQMVEGGFNLVWCGSEAELDVAHRHGLRGQLTSGLFTPASLDDPDRRQQLDALIARVSKHPALYSYHLIDEPSAAQFPALGKLVAYLRQRDPLHLAYINLFPTYANNQQLGTKGDTVTAYAEHLRLYVEQVKPSLISYDHYQFRLKGDSDQYFLNLAMIRRAALQAGMPFLNIVQACTWAPDAMRIPNADELRYLVYTTAAYGAQGISYYVYAHPNHHGSLVSAWTGRRDRSTTQSNRTIASSSLSRRSSSRCVRSARITPRCANVAASHCHRMPSSASIRRRRPSRREAFCSVSSALGRGRLT
ncbi:MAG: hypothetical protein QM570_10165 [Planctomycetota bacterium]|nr:hypothetical protein [Planctomycetota bacterium]